MQQMKGVKPPPDPAWEAMNRGDYERALELYDKQGPDRDLAKVRAWFHLERFEEARSALADAQQKREKLRAPQSYRCDLAVATWLCGERIAAVEILETECDAILSGKTGYLTSSFGTDEGVYLFYFGAATRDEEVIRKACAYLEKLSEKRFFIGSPSPPRLHDYFRNRLSHAGMQELVSRLREEKSQAIVVVNRDPEETERVNALFQSRDMAKLDFWRAIRTHWRESKRAAQPFYQKVAEAPPMLLLSDEWHLARRELKSGSSSRASTGNGE